MVLFKKYIFSIMMLGSLVLPLGVRAASEGSFSDPTCEGLLDEEIIDSIDIDAIAQAAGNDPKRLSHFKTYLKSISRYKVISAEELLALLPEDGSEISPRNQQQIINGNLRLVVKIALSIWIYKNKSDDIMNLIQAGNIGLTMAASKINRNILIENEMVFSTYAGHWIRGEISGYFHKNSGQPQIRHRDLRIAGGVRNDIESARLSPQGVDYELLARRYSLANGDAVLKLLDKSTQFKSVEYLDDRFISRINEFSHRDTEEAQISQISQREVQTIVVDALRYVSKQVFTPKENFIFTAVVLNGETLESTGAMIGRTRERVRQILEGAINKLRNHLRKRSPGIISSPQQTRESNTETDSGRPESTSSTPALEEMGGPALAAFIDRIMLRPETRIIVEQNIAAFKSTLTGRHELPIFEARAFEPRMGTTLLEDELGVSTAFRLKHEKRLLRQFLNFIRSFLHDRWEELASIPRDERSVNEQFQALLANRAMASRVDALMAEFLTQFNPRSETHRHVALSRISRAPKTMRELEEELNLSDGRISEIQRSVVGAFITYLNQRGIYAPSPATVEDSLQRMDHTAVVAFIDRIMLRPDSRRIVEQNIETFKSTLTGLHELRIFEARAFEPRVMGSSLHRDLGISADFRLKVEKRLLSQLLSILKPLLHDQWETLAYVPNDSRSPKGQFQALLADQTLGPKTEALIPEFIATLREENRTSERDVLHSELYRLIAQGKLSRNPTATGELIRTLGVTRNRVSQSETVIMAAFITYLNQRGIYAPQSTSPATPTAQ